MNKLKLKTSRVACAAATVMLLITSLASYGLAADRRSDLLKQAARELRRGNLKQAESIYRGLVTQDDGDVEARLQLSCVLIKMRRLQEAYDEAGRVAVADASNSRARALVGTALLRAGRLEAAKAQLARAFELDRHDAIAIGGLAEIEFFENRTQQAYDAFRRAIDLDSREPDFYRPFARVCSRLELYSEAADALTRFLDVAPKTDEKQRARINGIIQFYHRLGKRKLSVVSGDRVAAIAFDLINNRPYLNVMVNGKGPLRFVLDTGASFSMISNAAARKLGIKPLASGGEGRAVGGSGSFPLVYGVLKSVTIGGAKVENIPVYIQKVHKPTNSSPRQDYDGYFGLSLLSNYLVTIDYRQRMITLDRGENSGAPDLAENATVAIPIRTTNDGLASAETRLPEMAQPLNFIVDTGASVTVISRAVVKQNNLERLIIPGERTQVVGAAGIDEDVESLILGAITLDSLRKSNARAIILNLEAINEESGFQQHGILGGDFLRDFRIQLDLRRYQLTLTPQNVKVELVKVQSR